MSEIVNEIGEILWEKFKLECKVEGSYILINEFDGYIKDYNTYKKMEELVIGICRSVRESHGDYVDLNYEIIGQCGEYDLKLEIIDYTN